MVPDVVADTGRVMSEFVRAPRRMAATAADVAGLNSAADALPRQIIWQTRALFDLRPQRTHRRVWTGRGHAHIEVRGLTGRGPRHRRVAAQVRGALSGMRGVGWAEINAVTGQVLVAFDEGQIDVGALLAAVRAVEEAEGTRQEGFSWERPVHPSDNTRVAATAVELAADGIACAAAIVGRLTRLPALPRAVRVGLILADLQPQLRRGLAQRIGRINTDFMLTLTYATIQGLSQRPVGPAIDALLRAQLLAEALACRAVWERREPELCRTPEALPQEAPRRSPRPGRLPPGPIESWMDVLGPGSLAAAGTILAITRNRARVADTVLAAVPRAALLGREAFAATAAGDLARRGILPLDAAAYRRLDRISAVVLDSSVLRTYRPQILIGEGEGGNGRADRVTVGGELAPLADVLVGAARDTGARVLLTDDASVAELVSRADEMLPSDQPLAAHVRRLQREGHAVLLVSGRAGEALAAADVGVAIVGQGSFGCWSADLLCGPGLEGPSRVLAVTAAARPLSTRVLRFAQAGSSLGTLLAFVGPRRRGGKTYAMAPVHGAALVGLFEGTRAARRATRQHVPRLP
jgi:hypothetical protein